MRRHVNDDSVAALLDDFEAECDDVGRVLSSVDPGAWTLPTPADRWTIRDQVSHLSLSDAAGVLAATRPDEFASGAKALLARITAERPGEPRGADDPAGAGDLAAEWRTHRVELIEALRALPPDTRLPWFGPPMSVRSFVTARLMETWAHGLDIAEALAHAGLAEVPAPTDRLRHVCHLGVLTRGWSYTVRGLDAPTTPVHVDLVLPSGTPWTAGDPDASDTVTGAALDFCLVVAQRRNVADTALSVRGSDAGAWLAIAQCFAGRASLPPAPSSG